MKYKLTNESMINAAGKKLFRIKALVDIEEYGVKAGDLGGWIEKKKNLRQAGDAWVSGDAQVSENAKVSGDAQVSGNAKVSGDAKVCGNAEVSGDAWVYGNAEVSGDAWVSDDAEVFGDAWVSGNAQVCGYAHIFDDAMVCGDAEVSGNAKVSGNAQVFGDTDVSGDAQVSGNAKVFGDADYSIIKGFGTVYRTTTFFRCQDGAVRVTCGRFYGTIAEFREQVKQTRDGKVAAEYLKIADLMEYHFKEDGGING